MRFVARKVSNAKGAVGIMPTDSAGDEALRKYKDGAYVTVEVKQPRNPYHHRLFFALLHKVFENQERYPTEDHLRLALTYEAGYFKEYPMSDGLLVTVPDSISYESMDQKAFEDYFNRVCDIILRDYLPHMTKESLVAELETMMGARAA